MKILFFILSTSFLNKITLSALPLFLLPFFLFSLSFLIQIQISYRGALSLLLSCEFFWEGEEEEEEGMIMIN